ncbi:MAG: hypothetical protein JO257_23520 [Deltaproteobacteria bacterium]|nr:hypothetical protein [Deltaproteobacteria bacterium]
MTTLRLVAASAIALAGCYTQTPVAQYPDQEVVSGPPGGGMDQPTYAQYEADSQPSESQAPAQAYGDPGYAPDNSGQPVEPEPSADPQDPGYAMGPVNDAEIDTTLNTYGDWVQDPDYGRVWRPYATVVGVDFTPYETCGQWIWTDWGWSYSCDWDWGWLPFHYGRWNWFDGGYWGWVPGYEWGPGWVDWRNGGSYVGWRPSAPEFHDHRGQHTGPEFHDHRSVGRDSQWRFVSNADFGKGHIRGHLYGDLAEGLRATTPVPRPDIRGATQPVRVASTMRARMDNPIWRQQHQPVGGWRQPMRPTQPGRWNGNGGRWNGNAQQGVQTQGWRQPPAWQGVRQPIEPHAGGWQGPRQPVTVPRQTWQQPNATWQQPSGGWRQPPRQTWTTPQPQHPTWNEPRPAPSGGGWNAPRPTYNPPAYHPAPTWNAPRPSAPSGGWSGPRSSGGGGWSAPSHSSGGGGWSAPSHSSGGGGSFGGGGHSFGGGGGGGHSSGGGGHRR